MKMTMLVCAAALVAAVALGSRSSARAEPAGASSVAQGVTIFARPTTLAWTQAGTLYGAAPGALPDEIVEIEARDCGSTFFRTLVELHAGSGGGWSTPIVTPVTATFRARWKNQTSGTVTIRQGAWVTLERQRSGAGFVTAVTAKRSFWRKRVEIQRQQRGGWRTLRSVVLTDSVRSTGSVSATQARFRLSVPKGTRLRAVLPAGQAKPCYVRSVSKVVVA